VRSALPTARVITVLALLPACSASEAHPATDPSTSTSTGALPAETSTTGLATSSSSSSSGDTNATTSVADSSSTGDNLCASPLDVELNTELAIFANDWPDYGPISATCSVFQVSPDENPCCSDIDFRCAHPSSPSPIAIRVIFRRATYGDRLDTLEGASGLRFQFYNPENQIDGGPYYGTVSLRDAAGDLILLASQHMHLSAQLAQGEQVEMAVAGWLDPEDPEYDAWHAPFGPIWLRNIGCPPHDALRPGANIETPLVMQLDGDEGPLTLFDRSIESGVLVGGSRFDLIVSDAFFRDEINCGDCPVTEAKIALVRAP
jgi:hypothetical protein